VISDLLWRGVARIVTIPAVTDWLIARARRTPYFHITGPYGSVYMERYWLFNPYPPKSDGGGKQGIWALLPSVRIHHIRRPDSDRHLHSHPWMAARTILLEGWYVEELPNCGERVRVRGDTGLLRHDDFHRIERVSPRGVWTLFITYRKAGTWYFDVDGRKVPWREYLGEEAA
jgi:hypothetical protein